MSATGGTDGGVGMGGVGGAGAAAGAGGGMTGGSAGSGGSGGAPGQVVFAAADAHVRDGSHSSTNFGDAPALEVMRSTSDDNREAYLRFALDGFSGTVQRATLRLYGKLSSPGSVPIVARLMPPDSFDEGSVTHESKPEATPIELARAHVNGTSSAWYELDVTGLVRHKRRHDEPSIDFMLHTLVPDNPLVTLHSSEAESHRPELVIHEAKALFVVGDTDLGAGDRAVHDRLDDMGFELTVEAGEGVTRAAAEGQSLVVVSSTASGFQVGRELRDVAVPVVTWLGAAYGEMGMTGAAADSSYGTTSGQTEVTIVDDLHALAGGRRGSANVAASGPHSWGKPNGNAQRVATLGGDASRWTVFGYDKGASLVGMNAPERRVGLFLGDDTAASMTRSGWALFDAAINWAARTRPFIVKKLLVINYDPILEAHGNVPISQHFSWWHSAHDLVQTFITDLEQATGDSVRYELVGIVDRDEWPLAEDGTRYDDTEYLLDYEQPSCTEDSDCRSNDCIGNESGSGYCASNLRNTRADYEHIIDEFGINSMIDTGDVDDVFIAAPPALGFGESRMVGPNAYFVNYDPLFTDTARNYMVNYIDTSRTVALFQHGYLHRLEWVLRHVHGEKYGPDGIGPGNWNTVPYDRACFWATSDPTCEVQRRHSWDDFTLVDGVAQNLRERGDSEAVAGVGAVHFVPNAQAHADDNYNYGESRSLPAVTSTADDWLYNFPNRTGETRQVEVTEWPYTDADRWQYGFMLWFMNHVPRAAGRQSDGVLNNWWEYVVNYNDYPEALD